MIQQNNQEDTIPLCRKKRERENEKKERSTRNWHIYIQEKKRKGLVAEQQLITELAAGRYKQTRWSLGSVAIHQDYRHVRRSLYTHRRRVVHYDEHIYTRTRALGRSRWPQGEKKGALYAETKEKEEGTRYRIAVIIFFRIGACKEEGGGGGNERHMSRMMVILPFFSGRQEFCVGCVDFKYTFGILRSWCNIYSLGGTNDHVHF